MRLSPRNLITVLKTSATDWFANDPFRQSAVIAYYAIFSLPGLLVVVITLAGYFFGRDAVNTHLTAQITATFGADTADQIKGMVAKAGASKSSILATLVGIITILVGATGVFAQFQKSLNIIWEVKADSSKTGIWYVIKIRLFSFGLIISIAFILIVSLVVSTALSAFGSWLSDSFSPAFVIILQIINFVVSLVIFSFLFALMFKFLPDAKIKWRAVWIGAIVTTILFDIGKWALGLYFGKANPASGYGAAGSVILILIWVSYTSMIVFYGAEFTHSFAKSDSGKIVSVKTAVKKSRRDAK